MSLSPGQGVKCVFLSRSGGELCLSLSRQGGEAEFGFGGGGVVLRPDVGPRVHHQGGVQGELLQRLEKGIHPGREEGMMKGRRRTSLIISVKYLSTTLPGVTNSFEPESYFMGTYEGHPV